MYKFLEKDTVDELKAIKTFDNFSSITNEEDRTLLQAAYRRNKEPCENCKKSLEETGVVCRLHWHDYVLCGEQYCYTCLVTRSRILYYPDERDNYE